MSRLNYIISRHRTQSRTLAYMMIWFGMHPNYLQTLKAGGRERERERERERLALAYESRNLKKFHVSVLKMILGDAPRAHRLLHDKVGYSTVLMLCMLSIACPNV